MFKGYTRTVLLSFLELTLALFCLLAPAKADAFNVIDYLAIFFEPLFTHNIPPTPPVGHAKANESAIPSASTPPAAPPPITDSNISPSPSVTKDNVLSWIKDYLTNNKQTPVIQNTYITGRGGSSQGAVDAASRSIAAVAAQSSSGSNSQTSSQWTSTGSDIYYSDGNVGIGTNTPTSPLTVAGDATVSGDVSAASFNSRISTAALSATGPTLGAEILTNGDFHDGLTGWTALLGWPDQVPGGWSIVGGHAVSVDSGELSTPTGSSGKVLVTLVVSTKGTLNLGNSALDIEVYDDNALYSEVHDVGTYYFVADAGKIYFWSDGDGWAISSVSVKPYISPLTTPYPSLVTFGNGSVDDSVYGPLQFRYLGNSFGIGNLSIENNAGNYVTALGNLAAENNTKDNLTALGFKAAQKNTGAGVTAIGLGAALTNNKDNLTAIGLGAGQNNSGGNVSLVGDAAGINNTGSELTAMGFNSAYYNTGYRVVAIGNGSASDNTGDLVTAVGVGTAGANKGSTVTAIGVGAAGHNTGNNVEAIGGDAASGNTGGSVMAIGTDAASANTGSWINAIGFAAGIHNTGSHSVMIGTGAGGYNTGDYLTAMGYDAGVNNTAVEVTALGPHAAENTTSSYLIAIGGYAAQNNTGRYGIMIGHGQGASLAGDNGHGGYDGDYDTFIGQGDALLGTQKHVSNSVVIGGNSAGINNNGASAITNIIAINGVATESNQTVIGNPNTAQTLLYGNVGIGTSTPTLGPLTMNSGAYVTAGGVWTNASDRNSKENFATMTPTDILAKINALPVTEWNYKAEGPTVKHIGPVAQDFYSIFGLGNNDTSISTIDPAGVALLGIQALSQRIDQLSTSTPRVTFIDNSSLADTLGYFAGQIVGGVVHFGQVVVDKITATLGIFHQVRTDELCVGSTCVTESELKALLDKNGIAPAGSVPAASPTIEMGTQTATTSAPDTASTTPPADPASPPAAESAVLPTPPADPPPPPEAQSPTPPAELTPAQ